MRKILDRLEHGLVGVDRVEKGAEALGMANKKIHFLKNLIKLKPHCQLELTHAFSPMCCNFEVPSKLCTTKTLGTPKKMAIVNKWSLFRCLFMLQWDPKMVIVS